jgi:hypothetical protein
MLSLCITPYLWFSFWKVLRFRFFSVNRIVCEHRAILYITLVTNNIVANLRHCINTLCIAYSWFYNFHCIDSDRLFCNGEIF